MKPYVILVAAIQIAAGLGSSQFNTSVQGVVTDSTGAVVPEATVRVVNVATGVTRDVTTSSKGLYRLVSLGPGIYQASAEAKGFRLMTRQNIVLGISDTIRVDFTLQIP